MDLVGCCNHRFFAVLIYYGVDILPQNTADSGKVITTEGQVLYTGQDVKDGQNVWQSIGGQTVGSIWGTELILPQTDSRLPPSGSYITAE